MPRTDPPAWPGGAYPARPPPGADPVLDQQAKAQYAARLAELDASIVEADRRGDPDYSRSATAERAALIHELTAAAGLGGRTRRLNDETERARKTVSARIRDALDRIERVHPALAKHLRETVNTGTTGRYTPDDGRGWHL